MLDALAEFAKDRNGELPIAGWLGLKTWGILAQDYLESPSVEFGICFVAGVPFIRRPGMPEGELWLEPASRAVPLFLVQGLGF
jgi:hypothetical protein